MITNDFNQRILNQIIGIFHIIRKLHSEGLKARAMVTNLVI